MALNNPYALYFDGEDDYIVVEAGTITAPYTFELWINPTALSGYQVIFFQTAPSGSGASAGLRFVGNRLYAHMTPNTLNIGTFENNKMVHVAYTVSDNEINAYVNGTITAQTTHSGVISCENPIIIGANSRTLGQKYHGYMDEFRFWSYARTQAQIQENMYKTLTGTETGLELYLRFDTGTGDIAVDSSPNGYHGEIVGATWVPGLVDLEGLAPPGRVDISAVLGGSASMSVGKADHIRGLSAHLAGAATSTGGEPIRIRGLSANLEGAGTTNIRMNLIAALKASLQGKAALKSNILVLFVPEGVYVIDADEIFAKDQPSRGQVVANYIEVWVNPLKPTEEPEEVYRSKDPVAIPPGATETITIHFDDDPVTEPVATLEEAGVNLSIVDTKYYAWGADVKIKNAGSGAQTCIIVATGKPLKVQGREMVVRKDEVSIQENGLKKYTFDNPFVQDRATAELIADKLLSFSNAKRDIVIEWRGDPALELADVTMIPEYQRRDIDQRGIFYVTKQELEFDGGLRARLEGRKM